MESDKGFLRGSCEFLRGADEITVQPSGVSISAGYHLAPLRTHRLSIPQPDWWCMRLSFVEKDIASTGYSVMYD